MWQAAGMLRADTELVSPPSSCGQWQRQMMGEKYLKNFPQRASSINLIETSVASDARLWPDTD